MSHGENMQDPTRSPVGRLIGLCLEYKLLVAIGVLLLIFGGIMMAPFDWTWRGEVVKPVPVDAIPNLGENQQVIFTEWPGQSPEDVEEQLTYPLTSALLGTKGVKSVRSNSLFGFSSIYVIFDESEEFYDSRTRLLEKVNSLVEGKDFPEGTRPQLGPDATALGQVYWYTLEARDEAGRPTGGWDLDELRTIQDYTVRYALTSAQGVSEVASIGGYVREYQIDLDPDTMRLLDVSLKEVYTAVSRANTDVGAKTVELNHVEYFVRGVGFIQSISQLEHLVIKNIPGKQPVLLKQVATVALGPAQRRGALDKNGVEAVGGVVVCRFDANPLETIHNVQKRIDQLQSNLSRKILIDWTQVSPEVVQAYAAKAGFGAMNEDVLNQVAWLEHWDSLPTEHRPAWATLSQVHIVPFYDRTELIAETLGTLESALTSQILVTFIVIVLMVLHWRSSFLIGAMLPLALCITFIAMRVFGIDANIVALAGIAIAIGTIVDMGIVICDNIMVHLAESPEGKSRLRIVHEAASEVGSSVMVAGLTTIVGFLPVFTLAGKAGRLFSPLAYTKTFALVAAILVALLILPSACWLLLRRPNAKPASPTRWKTIRKWTLNILLLGAIFWALSISWMPLTRRVSVSGNLLFVVILIAVLIAGFRLFQTAYPRILGWALAHKKRFLSIPLLLLFLGLFGWLGFDTLIGTPLSWVGLHERAAKTSPWKTASRVFPGLGREFMPDFDEGTFLWMPTLSVHGSVAEALDVLQRQDQAIRAIPEVELVVGKIGRADSPLDPAPLSMIETVVAYKPEYRWDESQDQWVRQWRDHIQSPNDIWNEIVRVGKVPGATIASKGYPIQIRQVMLQTGMTATMGIKVFGPNLRSIESAADKIGKALETIPAVRPGTINVDRVVGKPYLVVDVSSPQSQQNLQQYGLNPRDVLEAVRLAIGGDVISTAVQGRERVGIRLRYQRERRDTLEDMAKILIDTPSGKKVPLDEIVTFNYVRGPQMIRSENTFKVAYVTFDTTEGLAEVDAAATIATALDTARRNGTLHLPANVTYELAGSYENELKANQTLVLIIPIALLLIFLILYMQFRSALTTAMVFSGVAVAFSGGFILLWFFGQPWLQELNLLGLPLGKFFQVHDINLSTAIWVGFLALFGIATDDGVVMGTYLVQTFDKQKPQDIEAVRAATIQAGSRRVRACLMTTATTILALLPVLTSRGRGSDLMIPMALPSFGGMAIEMLTMLVVPVLFCMAREAQLKRTHRRHAHADADQLFP